MGLTLAGTLATNTARWAYARPAGTAADAQHAANAAPLLAFFLVVLAVVLVLLVEHPVVTIHVRDDIADEQG